MLESNKISPKAAVRGYEKNNPSPIQMVPGYDRNLNREPLDTYEVEGQYALENPEVANRPLSYWGDAWKAFNNSRDEINLMSERSIIAREINPELEDIEKKLSNTDLLTEDEITELQNRRQELLEQRDEVNAEIEKLHTDIKDRGALSPRYQALQWQTERDASELPFYNTDYLKYTMPSTAGSSFSTLVQYGTALGGLAVRTAVKGLITAGAGAASGVSGGALTPLFAMAAADTAIAAADLATQWYQRRRESLAESYGAYKDRLNKDLQDRYGVGLEQYVEQARQSLMQQMDPNKVQDMSDDEVIDRILTGQVQINDDTLKQLSDAAKKGSDVVYNRNMALSALDMGQTALISNPVARGLKNIISKPIGKLLSPVTKLSNPATRKYNDLVDKYIAWNARLNINSPKTAAALKTAKDLAKYGIAAVSEGLEEGAQDVFKADYISGKYDQASSSYLSSLLGMVDANYRTAKIIAGIDTESELAKDPQFWNDVKAGVALGVFMGAPTAVSNSLVGTVKQLQANSMVRDISIENMQRKDTFAKVKAYADRAAVHRLNYDQEVLDTLEALKRDPSNLPDGITEEDVDAEIALAKRTFNTVGNPEVRAMAKEAGFAPGSEEFSTYIALVNDSMDEVRKSAENVADNVNKLQTVTSQLNQDFETLGLNEDDKSIEKALTIINGQREALNQLLENIESDGGALQKFGITSKDHPLAKQIKKEVKANIEALDKQAKDLVKDNDKYDANFYRPTEHASEAAAQYLMTLLSNINHQAVTIESNILHGVLGDDGKKLRYFRSLSKEDKKKVGNAIKDKVETYLKDARETARVQDAAAQEMAGVTPTSNETQSSSPEDTATKKTSYDDSIPTTEPEVAAEEPRTIPNQPPVEQPATEPTRTPSEQDRARNVEEGEEEVSEAEVEAARQAAQRRAQEGQQATSTKRPDEDYGKMPTVIADDVETEADITEGPIDETVEEANARYSAETDQQIFNQQRKESKEAHEMTIAEIEEQSDEAINREAAFQQQDGINPEDSLTLEGLEVADGVSSTMFYSPTSDKPLLPGYKPGKDLAKLLEQPGAVAECNFRFIINDSYTDPDYRSKPYKKGDPSTYDAASILIEVNHPSGKYLMALRTPKSAEKRGFNRDAIDRLKTNRNEIIKAIENKTENQEVIPVGVRSSNGVYNQNVKIDQDGQKHPVFRPVGDGTPSAHPTMEAKAENFVIGKGILGEFILFDKFGQIRPGHGGSGQLFYMAKPSQTLSGRELPIQVNVGRFNFFLANALLDMLIQSRGGTRYLTEDGYIEANEILDFIVHNGPQTFLRSDDPRVGFLLDKQLGFDDQGLLIVGRKMYNPASLTEQDREEIIGTLRGMHYSIDKNTFWAPLRNALPSVAEYFDRTNAVDVAVLPGVVFTREQFENPEFTTFDWLAYNGLITTDIQDNFFTDSFHYFSGITTVERTATSPKAISDAAVKAEKMQEVEGKSTEITEDSVGETTAPSTSDTPEENEFLAGARKGIDPLNIFGDNYDPGFEVGPARKLRKNASKKKVTKAEVKWFRDTLGLNGERIDFVDQAIALGNDEFAMGLCKLYSTVLWTGAETGTLYHEAFHKVNLLLLSPEERQKVYEMYRNRTGFIGTDADIEELLAEEFRQFMLDRVEHRFNLVKRMFRVIKNFINKWFNKSDYNIHKLFERINSGYYRDRELNKASVNEWLDRFKEDGGAPFKFKGHEFKNITNTQINETISTLASSALIMNNVRLIGDVKKLDLGRVKQALDPRVNQELVKQGRLTSQQAEVRREIFDNFDNVFKDEIIKYLSGLRIKVSDSIDLMDQETEAKADGTEVGDEMAKHILESNEVSAKDNALTTVKVFVACLPNIRFIDGDPNKVAPVLNQATGLPTTVNFHQAWNTLARQLADCNSFDEIVARSAKLAKENGIFKAFHTELLKLTAPIENETDRSKIARENLITQIENTFKKHISDFIFASTVENKDDSGNVTTSIILTNESANKYVKDTLAGWLNELIHYTGLIKVDENGSYVVDDETVSNINALSKKFNDFVEPKVVDKITDSNLVSAKNDLLSLLSEMGIPVDIESLNSLLNDQFYDQSPLESFKRLLRDTSHNGVRFIFINKLNDLKKIDSSGNIPSGKFSNPISRLYNNSVFAKKLAEHFCVNHPTNDELYVLSTDDKRLYAVTESNYLSDFTKDLNNNPELIEQLKQVMYVAGDNSNTKNFIKGSVVLNNLAKGDKLKIETLVGFRHSGTDDAGRKYTKISPLENYVMRMGFTRANKLVLPTMGDSGRYDVLTGSAVDNFSKKVDVDLEKGRLSFDSAITRRFVNYFEAELDTIEYNYNNLPQTPQETVKNYDTGPRNGYRFRNFNGMNLMGITGENAGKLNEALAEAERIDMENNDSNYTQAKNVVKQFRDRWNSLSFKEKTELLDDYLKDLFVRRELVYAKEIGLIEFDGRKLLSVSNLAIPSQYVADASAHYSGKYAHQLGVLEVLMNNFANHISAKIEFNKLYTKDPAYYKNETDMIKRLREVLSTGVKPRLDYINNPEMQDLTDFNVATFNDNVIVSRQFDSIKKSAARSFLYKLLINNGLSQEAAITEMDNNGEMAKKFEDQANQMAANMFKGYGKVNQTDATVLISPEGYKQLVRRIDGWTPEVEKAFNILNNPDILTSDDPTLYQESLNTLIKPLKVMYFGGTINDRLKREVPIFDKMALFPVFPVIATGDMKHVLDAMQKQNIHMIAFDSAVKVGQDKNTNLYNEDGTLNIEGINHLPYHKQPLKYFRRQLITDPHDSGHDQLFVSQAQKAMMANIRHDGYYTLPDGTTIDGSTLLSNINGCIDALTRRGEEEFNNKFGVTTDEDGNRLADPRRTRAELLRAAERSNMNQNVIEGLSGDYPINGLSDTAWMESSLISTVGGDIVDVRTPGGMFIQMSSIAYNDLSTTRSRDLKFDNEDGSMECVISINLLKNLIPDYDKKSFKESKEWLQKVGLIGRDTKAMAIGYRIPAQGPSSVAALKVVDVYPENIGDTITLPDEWTALTGSDFDIDKLYVARYSYQNGKKIELETREQYEERLRKLGLDDETVVRRSYERFNGKTVFEANSKEAVQNYLIDNYLASITAPLQYSESKKPLDATTDYLKDRVLKDIDELSGNTTEKETSQLYYGTPSFQNQTKDDLISGKLHLGVFALATSHHSLAQSVGLAFKSNVISTKYNLLSLSSIDSQQPNYWDKDIVTYTSISDWLSAMVNAHVDVAKDPYINRLNVRTLTLPMTAMLLRAGKGESTFYFLAQPALVQAAKEYEKNSGFYGAKKITPINQIRTTRDLLVDKAAELFGRSSEVYTKISEAAMLDLTPEEARNMFDIDYLRSIMPRSNKPEWFIGQLRVLKAFEEMHPFSKALSELTTISQIDTKKYGNNFALQQNFLIKISNFLRNSAAFVNPSAVIKNTFLREKLRAALINPRNIFSNSLLRVSRDFETRRALLYARTVGYDSDRITDNVATALTRAMESNFKLKAITSHARANGVRATDLLYGDNSIPRRLIRIKRLIQSGIFPELLKSDGTFENALLDNIDPMLKTTPVDFVLPDFLVFKANKSSDGNVDDLVIRAWEELLTFDTEVEANKKEAEEIRRFARDLAIYAMYTSGDAFGKNNIFKYVPNSFRETSGYFDQIRQLEQDPSNYYNQLDDDNLIRNLWWNDEIVPQLDLYTTSYDEFGMETRSIRPNVSADYFINDVNVPGLFTADFGEVKFLYTNKFGQPVFTPYVKLALGEKNDPRTTKLYKFVGYEQSETSNGRTILRPVYKLVTKKGLNYKGKVVTEVIGSENSPSVVKINNESFNVDLPSLNIIPLTTNLPDPDKYKSIFDPIGVINRIIFDEGATSRATQQSLMKQTEISSKGYRKGLPQENPDIDYVFTENAEVYTYTQNLREGYTFPNPNDPKINVSDMDGTNQAGIRTDREGNLTPNAYGIVVKKYQQNAYGKFVDKEGQFQDTDEDFAMFTRLNEDMFSKLQASTNTKIVFPSQMALGKAALPLRFAEWLQFELQLRFNVESVVEINLNPNYDGYGLRITDARPIVRADLSNFAVRPFTIDNTGIDPDAPISGTFQTVEGAFQAQKLEYSSIGEEEIESIRKQLETASGKQAITIGRSIKGLDKAAWDKVSSSLMHNLIKASFEQNPEALQRLLSTGNATLTHTQDEGKWGTEFPRILMEVREELRNPTINENEGDIIETSNSTNSTLESVSSSSLESFIDRIFPNWRTEFPDLPEEIAAEFVSWAIVPGIDANTIKERIETFEDLDVYDDIQKAIKTGNKEVIVSGIASAIDYELAKEGISERDMYIKLFGQDFVDNADRRVSEIKAEAQGQTARNTYTFSNGFSVTTPFKLNDQQERALAKLNEFIDNETDTSITLSGYAGTGKTTVISILDKYLKNRRIPTVYLAPTHRANAVTMMMNPNVSANTIHKFLGIRPDIDISSDVFDVSSINFDDTAFSTEGSGDLLIIDESSMIPDSLADILIQFASRSGKQIIFVGDSAQLKPVNNHGRISKIFREDNGEVIELTKVERTGDNAILEEATRLREGNDLTYNSKLNSRGEGVTYTNIRDELMSFISDNLKSAEFAADPLYFRILSATNKAIPGYNQRAREMLYGKDIARTEWLVPGELLMGYENEKQDRKEEIHNSFDYKVVKFEKDSRTLYGMQNSVKVDGYYTVLKDLFNPGINQKIFILNPNTPQETLYEIADIIDSFYAQYKQLRNSGRSREAKKVYAILMAFKQSFATMAPLYGRNGNLVKAKSLDYGYAHTIHKSQGGTYNKVVILGGTVNSFEDAQTRQQLKYVAITRAKERVMYSVPEGVKISNNITVMGSNPAITELKKSGIKRQDECK